MKALIASAFAFAVVVGASSVQAAPMFYLTVDTVGNCSVSEGKPSAGQKALGETGGYANKADADAKLASIRGDDSTRKGVVE
jgi:hypothetical protein